MYLKCRKIKISTGNVTSCRSFCVEFYNLSLCIDIVFIFFSCVGQSVILGLAGALDVIIVALSISSHEQTQ